MSLRAFVNFTIQIATEIFKITDPRTSRFRKFEEILDQDQTNFDLTVDRSLPMMKKQGTGDNRKRVSFLRAYSKTSFTTDEKTP